MNAETHGLYLITQQMVLMIFRTYTSSKHESSGQAALKGFSFIPVKHDRNFCRSIPPQQVT